MQTLELEKEFENAKFSHMVRVVKSYLEKEYKEECSNQILLPPFMAKDACSIKALADIQAALKNNTFIDLYKKAWYYETEN